jgi:hypothetical protein
LSLLGGLGLFAQTPQPAIAFGAVVQNSERSAFRVHSPASPECRCNPLTGTSAENKGFPPRVQKTRVFCRVRVESEWGQPTSDHALHLSEGRQSAHRHDREPPFRVAENKGFLPRVRKTRVFRRECGKQGFSAQESKNTHPPPTQARRNSFSAPGFPLKLLREPRRAVPALLSLVSRQP